MEAWSDLAVSETQDGRAHVTAVAFFPNINALHFDMPLDFVWTRNGPVGTLTIAQRHRPSV